MYDAAQQMDREMLEDRYQNYASLSRLFRVEIDQKLLDELRDGFRPEPADADAIDAACKRIRAYLDAAAEGTRSELAIDYCLTFLGYGADPDQLDRSSGNRAAYPYESIYTSDKKTLLGDTSVAIEMIYRQHGFQSTSERSNGQDHIACELEFMQFICGLQLLDLEETGGQRLDELLLLQRSFLDEHLLRWVPAFAEAIEHFSETDFYPALGRLAEALIHADSVTINEVLRCAGQPA
jgi:TorA maturation chaperone TorD